MDGIEAIIRRIVREEIRAALAKVITELPGVTGVSPASRRLMTIEEVADLLGVAVRTLYSWNSKTTPKRDWPEPIKVGGRLRWERSAVEQWIAEKS